MTTDAPERTPQLWPIHLLAACTALVSLSLLALLASAGVSTLIILLPAGVGVIVAAAFIIAGNLDQPWRGVIASTITLSAIVGFVVSLEDLAGLAIMAALVGVAALASRSMRVLIPAGVLALWLAVLAAVVD